MVSIVEKRKLYAGYLVMTTQLIFEFKTWCSDPQNIGYVYVDEYHVRCIDADQVKHSFGTKITRDNE